MFSSVVGDTEVGYLMDYDDDCKYHCISQCNCKLVHFICLGFTSSNKCAVVRPDEGPRPYPWHDNEEVEESVHTGHWQI